MLINDVTRVDFNATVELVDYKMQKTEIHGALQQRLRAGDTWLLHYHHHNVLHNHSFTIYKVSC